MFVAPRPPAKDRSFANPKKGSNTVPILSPARVGFQITDPVVAMTIKDAKAATTSIARSERLDAEGYTFRRLADKIVAVQGQPTTHKRRSGEVWIDPHGPYTVDCRAEICTCPAFANRGVCPHLAAAADWLSAWERGESQPISLAPVQEMIALRELGGEGATSAANEGSILRHGLRRFHCQDRRVVVFRNWERAAAYWQDHELVGLCELVALETGDLKALREAGRYTGLLLVTNRHQAPINFGSEGSNLRSDQGGATSAAHGLRGQN